jgi:hypothetical protein
MAIRSPRWFSDNRACELSVNAYRNLGWFSMQSIQPSQLAIGQEKTYMNSTKIEFATINPLAVSLR